VKGGDPAPSNPLGRVVGPVTVTIGAQTVQPVFAGLTLGFTGLYQVNVQMPSGVMSGNQVPVSISVGGKSRPASIFYGREMTYVAGSGAEFRALTALLKELNVE
jgi:uncharacterized protein (TIGR03437 family)